MTSKCEMCCLDFETNRELEVHVLSLSHHIKLESNGVTVHHCRQCNFTCKCVSDYSKHVNSEDHRKRRNRLLAIIDTAEDIGDPSEVNNLPESDMHKNGRDRAAFSRDDTRRMTCPTRLGHYPRPRHELPPAEPRRVLLPTPLMPFITMDSREPLPSGYRDGTSYDSSKQDQESYWNDSNEPLTSAFHRSASTRHSYHPGTSSSREGSKSSDRRSADANKSTSRSKKDSSRASRSSTENDKTAKSSDEPKRGIISRLSMRKKSSNVDGSKAAEKEKTSGSISVDGASAKRSSEESVAAGSLASSIKKKKAILPSSIAFAKKQFDLSHFMKRRTNDVRSQQSRRMQRERLEKFKLVDPSKGIEESEEDKTTPLRANQNSNQHLTSHIWGATPARATISSSHLTPQVNSHEGDSFTCSLLDETNFENVSSCNTSTPVTAERNIRTPTLMEKNTGHNSSDLCSPLGLPSSQSTSLAYSMSVGSSNSSLNGSCIMVKMEPTSVSPPPALQPYDNVSGSSMPSSAEVVSNTVQGDKYRELWDLTIVEDRNKKKIQEITLQLYQLQQEMEFIQMRKQELMGNNA